MFRFASLLALLACGAATTNAQLVCGDCDADGTVVVNELVTAVNNALNGGTIGTPTPTSTPIPDRCPAVQAGQTVSILGDQFVVVEAPVELADGRLFRVLFPVKQGEGGVFFEFPILQRGTVTFPNYPHVSTSRCGYEVRAYPQIGNNRRYEEFDVRPAVRTVDSILVNVQVVLDSEFGWFNVQLLHDETTVVPVAPIAENGFSAVSYPRQTVDTGNWESEMLRLLDYISISRM